MYRGPLAEQNLNLSGAGDHSLTLTVTSREGSGNTQSHSVTFIVKVQRPSVSGSGFNFYTFNRTYFKSTIDPRANGTRFEDYSGIVFDPLSRHLFIIDSKKNAILETDLDGNMIMNGGNPRIIDLSAFGDGTEDGGADPEGITRISGNTYAVVFEKRNELAVFNILPETTAITRAQATVYELPDQGANNVESLAYLPAEDAFFLANSEEALTFYKIRLNPATRSVTILDSFEGQGKLTATNVSAMTFAPLISPHLLVTSTSSTKVMEVVVRRGLPGLELGQVLSEMAVSSNDIPELEGISFDDTGRMFLVGQRTSSVQGEDDFNRFDPTPTPDLNPTDLPVAQAIVPSSVQANESEQALVTVDASASSGPNQEPILSYKWREGGQVLYEGAFASVELALSGVGTHSIELIVTSASGQSQPAVFSVTVNPNAVGNTDSSAGFARFKPFTRGYFKKDIDETPVDSNNPIEDFSGAAFNPLSQHLFLVDSNKDVLVETDLEGNILRRIDMSSFRESGRETANRAIAWIGGNKYAIAMENRNAIAVVTVPPGATALAASNAQIFQLPSDGADRVEGITYSPNENAIYFVNNQDSVTLFKGRFKSSTLTIDILDSFDTLGKLGVNSINDLAFAPRLSPHLLVLSTSPAQVLEVVVADNVPGYNKGDVVSRFLFSEAGITFNDIPRAGGLAFDSQGRMYIVGEKTSAAQGEQDFSRFDSTTPVTNLPPVSNIVHRKLLVVDADNNGAETLVFNGSQSLDPDGTIIQHKWLLDGAVVVDGDGLPIPNLIRSLPVGAHIVKLQLTDDSQVTSETIIQVLVQTLQAATHEPPVASAIVPSEVFALATGQLTMTVNAAASVDLAGHPITRYQWILDGTAVVYDGSNPQPLLTFTTTDGPHVLTLWVYSTVGDESRLGSKEFPMEVILTKQIAGTSLQTNDDPSLNYVYPGSPLQQMQFAFEIKSWGAAQIYIYDQLGREVKKIQTNILAPERYREEWNLTDDNGHLVSSGVYFVLIKTPGETKKEKAVIIR